MDERFALADASAAMARLDESMRHHRMPVVARAWMLRSETLGIMECSEGEKVPEQILCHLLVDDLYGLSNLKQRVSVCIHSALDRAIDGPQGDEDVADWLTAIWSESESSNRHLDAGAAEWRNETSIWETAAPIRSILGTRSYSMTAECLRQLWISPSFDGKGRRMALLLAPHFLKTTFDAPMAQVGLARALNTDPDATRQASADPEMWITHFFEAVAVSARRAYEATQTLSRLTIDLNNLMPAERAGSRKSKALELFLQRPVRTVQDLASDLGMSDYGTTLIIEKMVKAGVVQKADGSSKQNRSYVCRKAMAV